MNDREKLNINITDSDVIDFDFQLSQKENAQLKKQVLSKIQVLENKEKPENKKAIILRRRVISIIAAAVLMIVSTSAIASITTYRKNMVNTEATEEAATQKVKKKKETQPQQYTVNQNNQAVPASTGTAEEKSAPKEKYVTLSLDGLEEYIFTEENGWYFFENTKNNSKNFDCQIIYTDTQWSRDFVQLAGIENTRTYTPEYQQFFIGDRKAMFVKYSDSSVYTQQLFVRYAEAGYVLSILADKGLEKEEFIALGSKITLNKCDKAQGISYIKFSDYLKNYTPDSLIRNVTVEAVDSEDIAQIKQTVTQEDCEITVESVEVLDNISNVASGLNREIADNVNLISRADGTLNSYRRWEIFQGDGCFTPENKKFNYQQVNQKFYLVEIKVKNTSVYDLGNFNTEFPLVYVTENEDGLFYDTTVHDRPYAEALCRKDNLPVYYSMGRLDLTLQAGQEQSFYLGYFVDEDLAKKMHLSLESQTTVSNLLVNLQ